MRIVDLDCAIHDAFYSLKRVNYLFNSTYAQYFQKDPEDVHGMGDASFRQLYEEVQLSLQCIAELLNGAMSSAEEAADIFDQKENRMKAAENDKPLDFVTDIIHPDETETEKGQKAASVTVMTVAEASEVFERIMSLPDNTREWFINILIDADIEKRGKKETCH